MAKTPSTNFYAKDVIGQGLNISTNKAKQDRAQLIGDYNMAVAEIYNILGFIDTQAYLEIASGITSTMDRSPKCGIIDLTAILSWDKIIELEILNISDPPMPIDNGEEVDYSIYSGNRSFGAAIDPYDESVIFTVVKNSIRYVIGESLDYVFNTILFNVVYRREPTILVISQYDFERMDVPDKYLSLLANRIASLIEYRAGIFDKSLAMVKTSYEQLLGSVDPIVRASLMKSLQTPVGAIQ